MTTPFSDDSLLPKAAPPMPVSPHGEATVLRSEHALWQRRAGVAAEVAAELARATRLLEGSARNNRFGDCIEGQQFTSSLRGALSSLSEQWRTLAINTDVLSDQCLVASSEIEHADSQGAADIEA
ncbi:hypothetical protein GDN83_02190 [Gordonia jinghuaiqii]|nr:hypothetical protein [Gordonia jinghuaiqii]